MDACMLSRGQGHFRLEVSVSLASGLPTAGALAFQVQSPLHGKVRQSQQRSLVFLIAFSSQPAEAWLANGTHGEASDAVVRVTLKGIWLNENGPLFAPRGSSWLQGRAQVSCQASAGSARSHVLWGPLSTVSVWLGCLLHLESSHFFELEERNILELSLPYPALCQIQEQFCRSSGSTKVHNLLPLGAKIYSL